MDTMDDTLEFDLLTAPILDERPWAVYAACRNDTTMNFFPNNREEERDALAVCNICPVTDDCLAQALATNERFGVWGGTTERERRKLHRAS